HELRLLEELLVMSRENHLSPGECGGNQMIEQPCLVLVVERNSRVVKKQHRECVLALLKNGENERNRNRPHTTRIRVRCRPNALRPGSEVHVEFVLDVRICCVSRGNRVEEQPIIPVKCLIVPLDPWLHPLNQKDHLISNGRRERFERGA